MRKLIRWICAMFCQHQAPTCSHADGGVCPTCRHEEYNQEPTR